MTSNMKSKVMGWVVGLAFGVIIVSAGGGLAVAQGPCEPGWFDGFGDITIHPSLET